MALHVTPGLERKNQDLIRQHLSTLKADQRKREESPEIADACKEAGRWVYDRGKGKRYIGMGRCDMTGTRRRERC